MTTQTFAEGKKLSTELRASTPEAISGVMTELQRIKKTARDFTVPSTKLTTRVEPGTGLVRASFRMPDSVAGNFPLDFGIRKTAHEQLAEKFGIPGNYARKMEDTAPGLLINNLNYWFNFNPQNLLLRTLDGDVRAALSDRYRALDSFDLLFNAAEVGHGMGAVMQRLDLSDDRFFFRMVLPDFAVKITGRGDDLKAKGKLFSSGYKGDNGQWGITDDDDPNGDWVFPAIVGSNSEVGKGKLMVDLSAFRATCSNYIVVSKSIHRVHLGERLDNGFEFSSDTREAKDRAVWLEVRDMIKAAFTEDKFRALVKAMNDAQAAVLEDPIAAVEVVVQTYGLDDADKETILRELLNPSVGSINPGATLWGLSQSVNVLAYERSLTEGYQLETIAGDLIQRGRELVAVKAR